MIGTILLQAPSASGSGMSSIIMMVVIFVIFYFFMIRPQQKKQKEIQKFRDSILVGDKVVTAGGIHGKIKEIKDTYVVLEIANNVNIQIEKTSIFKDPTAIEQTSAQ
jgi:preprotein translocase subunit YajC